MRNTFIKTMIGIQFGVRSYLREIKNSINSASVLIMQEISPSPPFALWSSKLLPQSKLNLKNKTKSKNKTKTCTFLFSLLIFTFYMRYLVNSDYCVIHLS